MEIRFDEIALRRTYNDKKVAIIQKFYFLYCPYQRNPPITVSQAVRVILVNGEAAL